MLRLYNPSNLSAAVKNCWDSDKLDELGDGAVTVDEESDVEDIMVTAEVWRDGRLKCVAGGSDCKDDVAVAWVVSLIPLVTFRGARFEGAETSPFHNGVTWLAMDL